MESGWPVLHGLCGRLLCGSNFPPYESPAIRPLPRKLNTTPSGAVDRLTLPRTRLHRPSEARSASRVPEFPRSVTRTSPTSALSKIPRRVTSLESSGTMSFARRNPPLHFVEEVQQDGDVDGAFFRALCWARPVATPNIFSIGWRGLSTVQPALCVSRFAGSAARDAPEVPRSCERASEEIARIVPPAVLVESSALRAGRQYLRHPSSLGH
jgi:hypothetical protein